MCRCHGKEIRHVATPANYEISKDIRAFVLFLMLIFFKTNGYMFKVFIASVSSVK